MNDVINRKNAIGAILSVGHIAELSDGDAVIRVSAVYYVLRNLPTAQPEIVRCGDCKHYYFADNRIPQEQRYTCELDGDRWNPDSFCSFAERRER